MRVAMVFPGQGTQVSGMGAPWQDHPAWKLLDEAERALGEPLRSLVVDAPPEQLARTRDAQLAVLCTSLVAWEALRPLTHDIVAFAGHSLGQVTALVASGDLRSTLACTVAIAPVGRPHRPGRLRAADPPGLLAVADRGPEGDRGKLQPDLLLERGAPEVERQVKQTPLEDWKTYLKWHLLRSASRRHSKAYRSRRRAHPSSRITMGRRTPTPTVGPRGRPTT